MKSSLKVVALLSTITMMAACAPQSEKAELINQDQSSQSIVGGEDVAAEDPLVKATVGIATRFGGVICTGTLIAKNLVVTAGHCTGAVSDPRQMYITFGHDLNSKDIQVRRVLGGKSHEKWPLLKGGQEKNWYDIAVLKFEGDVPAGFSPAVLLSNASVLKNGMEVTLAGFGVTSMQPKTTTDILQKTVVKLTNAKYSETELLFNQDEGKGACHGDSGGPAYVIIKGRAVLIGVTSRSATLKGGSTCLEGSIYTSVPALIQFLKQASIELNSKSFVPGKPIPNPI